MDINKLTLKSQEALQAAQRLASENNNQQVETAHLMGALLGQSDGVILPLMQKLGVAPPSLRAKVEGLLDRAPEGLRTGRRLSVAGDEVGAREGVLGGGVARRRLRLDRASAPGPARRAGRPGVGPRRTSASSGSACSRH